MSRGRSSRYGSADLPPKPPHEVVVDLHLHTTASDGALTPTQLIDLVAGTSLRITSITDHDTTDGIDEAQAAVSKLPHLTLIPGIELGTQDGPSEVHLLGYFINHRDAGLRAALAGFREERVVAARQNVEKLRSMGVKITWERVRELAGGTVGRPHIAKAMVEGGYVESVRDAFDKYLGDNGIGRVSRPKLDPVDALGIIHDAGGIGAIAHPERSRSWTGSPRDLPKRAWPASRCMPKNTARTSRPAIVQSPGKTAWSNAAAATITRSGIRTR